jgi:putative aldouronate transport system substrate-binding protein
MYNCKFLGRALCVLLAAFSSGPVFAAGGSQQASTGASNSEASVLNPLGQLPIVKERITMKIGMVRNSAVTDYAANFQTKELEKDSNIHLEFVFYGANDNEARQKLELEFSAGGEDLPDIISMGFDAASAQYYGEQGMILPLENLIASQLSYSRKSIDEIGYDPWKYIRTSNGHIYTLFTCNQSLASDVYTRMYMNTDWMKAVGKGMPKTTAEFEDLLKAFRNHKFNSDGIKEYPFIADKGTALSQRFFDALITPFVYANYMDRYLYKDEKGQIEAAYAAGGWREALTWIRGMVDQGLIDPLSFTQDTEQLKAIGNSTKGQNIGMTTMLPTTIYGANDPRAVNWCLLESLAGPNGKTVTSSSSIRLNPFYAISKNCKYPEAAFRLGDLMMSEKYSIMTRYGEEGVDWTSPAPEGSKSVFKGYKAIGIPILPWGPPQNKHWAQSNPFILLYRMSAGLAVEGKISGLNLWSAVMASNSLPYVQKEREIGPVIFTNEEFDRISEIRANVETYWAECYVRFLLRDMSLENDWGAYLSELKAMGLDTYLSVIRAAYARMK